MPGIGSSVFNLPVTNTGAIVGLSGRISLAGGGSFGGSINAANGMEVSFEDGGLMTGAFTAGYGGSNVLDSGAFILGPAVSFGGEGTNELTGSSIQLGNFLPANLLLLGGTIQLPATFVGGSITTI